MSREASESSRAIRASERAGTITHLAVQPSQPTRVAVFLDGVLACEVSQEVVRAWGLRIGRTLSAEEQVHLAAAEQLMAAQAVAMQYLAARPRTAHEVAQALWGNIAVTQAYLTLSEVLGHVDLLKQSGAVRELERGRQSVFEAA